MRRRNRYNNVKKERAVMIASTVFVLAAMTVTGIYVKSSNDAEKNDGYHIDFETLEEQAQKENDQPYQAQNQDNPANVSDDALDYAPPLAAADSGGVKIPGLTDGNPILLEDDNALLDEMGEVGQAEETDRDNEQTLADEAAMAADAANEAVAEDEMVQNPVSEDVQAEQVPVLEPQVSYSIVAGESLVWPVSGNVLINYSMDRTVYFATLQQYKYNPGIVIEATEGIAISSCAAGVITDIFYSEELGNGVKVDIGRGYTAIYGQLKDLQVVEGGIVSEGTVLGFVASPTKYYGVEGTNAYFALEKDGQPVNPFGILE